MENLLHPSLPQTYHPDLVWHIIKSFSTFLHLVNLHIWVSTRDEKSRFTRMENILKKVHWKWKQICKQFSERKLGGTLIPVFAMHIKQGLTVGCKYKILCSHWGRTCNVMTRNPLSAGKSLTFSVKIFREKTHWKNLNDTAMKKRRTTV